MHRRRAIAASAFLFIPRFMNIDDCLQTLQRHDPGADLKPLWRSRTRDCIGHDRDATR
jgi:hypothetical protein